MDTSASEVKPIIYIKTLGGFSIRVGDKDITDNSNQSKKPWCLLEYMVVFRNRDLSPSELINIIWADDAGSNPGGALKTLMFRSRKLLEPLGIPTQKLLVQKKGSYTWTQEYSTVIDIDQFELICTKVLNKRDAEEGTLPLCLEGLEMYKGDFLPKSEYESWVIPISTYYHSLFQKLVNRTVEILLEKKDYALITSICQKAVGIEPFDEEFHYNLVYSLYKDGHAVQAVEEYQRTLDLFYNEFSISPSDRFKELYKIIRSREQGMGTSLDMFQRDLRREAAEGAFCCEYPVFCDVYQLERRTMKRTRRSIYLCMLTLCFPKDSTPDSDVRMGAMEDLKQVIRISLRCSDIYTRYSSSQYLILLPIDDCCDGEIVLKRIVTKFGSLCPSESFFVEYQIQPVRPWE